MAEKDPRDGRSRPWIMRAKTVDEHRAVLLSEDVFSDLDDQVRAPPYGSLAWASLVQGPTTPWTHGRQPRSGDIEVGRTESRGGMVS